MILLFENEWVSTSLYDLAISISYSNMCCISTLRCSVVRALLPNQMVPLRCTLSFSLPSLFASGRAKLLGGFGWRKLIVDIERLLMNLSYSRNMLLLFLNEQPIKLISFTVQQCLCCTLAHNLSHQIEITCTRSRCSNDRSLSWDEVFCSRSASTTGSSNWNYDREYINLINKSGTLTGCH